MTYTTTEIEAMIERMDAEEELCERVFRMTPSEAWEVFVGDESPMEWKPQDANLYVAGSPLCSDLDPFAREQVRELLFNHILAQVTS